ncbi:hypothetical protein SAMN06265349_10618 [Flavobacterium resistens]|uniref:Methylamine utilisation protein MauE domain-containing protein n=1 Tax=Flavobacterium resistens TaxID=443612 RepID=A0A521EZA4_9FLAO|nr:MauE/DoxX family redox-associated membrane protein [Flavobacterium resistens]MRX69328.1 hypothetical protein [Flavobacterium resistens]SMO89239.1 hypothetical protein SAMN06265349_10618 [Flavobacterium resistens]
MKDFLISKSNLVTFCSVLLGAIFLLSAIGKYFDLSSFELTMKKYGLPYYISYIILFSEIFFAVCFIFLLFLKKSAFLSIVFVILMTIANTIGHFFLKIESCRCFGRIYFLNPDSFSLFLLRNAVLILLSYYIFKNAKYNKDKSLLKIFIASMTALIIVFLSLKYNTYYIENFSKKKIGFTVEELNINNEKINDSQYLFFFSPSCIHCKKAIAKINLLKEKYSINIVGITSKYKDQEKWKKTQSELKINFPIITVDRKIFNEITLVVPVIFKIKNHKVENVLEVQELLDQKKITN